MNNAASILFIDDEPGSRESLALLFAREGYQVEAVAAGEDALSLLSNSLKRAMTSS